MLWRELLPILLRRKVSKGICRALRVEEANVVGYLSGDILRRSNMEICKEFGLDPTINRLHRGIVCRCAGSGH